MTNKKRERSFISLNLKSTMKLFPFLFEKKTTPRTVEKADRRSRDWVEKSEGSVQKASTFGKEFLK